MIDPKRFNEFVNSIFGYEPFPWQTRLLQQVVAEGKWPELISVPTGTGKTAVIDVAVFSLACGVRLPRRTVMVVDRRLVVDAAFDRAKRLADKLCDSNAKGLIAYVASALLNLGGSSPLAYARLRGGMYGEPLWAKNPAQPLVLCTTVDQAGSRLLHCGYGVSSSMRPVHAGLLGNDTLIILDEAHISEPFRQTMEYISRLRSVADRSVPLPFQFVTMSATPAVTTLKPFALNKDDLEHPVLRKRLEARKIIALQTCSKSHIDVIIAETAVKISEPELPGQTGRTILVVVNRVSRARTVARLIEELIAKSKKLAIVEVVTGRSRPLDRDRLFGRLSGRLLSGRNRGAVVQEPPLFVISTQAIEVGADIDADALVTEACPLDALRQRIGRVDRLGELGNSTIQVIGDVNLETQPPEKLWEPVYGTRTAMTWEWLRSLPAPADLGSRAWEAIERTADRKVLAKCMVEATNAPVLFPAYCDLWVQTRPEPEVVPDPAYFLHGNQASEPEVHVIWRADIGEDSTENWATIVEAQPPSNLEAIPVPISQARNWLAGRDGTDMADVGSVNMESGRNRKQVEERDPLPCILWRGAGGSTVCTDPELIKVGDTIVVPTAYGGADRWGWNGEHDPNRAPTDLGDLARIRSGRYPILRLHPNLLPPGIVVPGQGTDDAGIDEMTLRQKVVDALDSLAKSDIVDMEIGPVSGSFASRPFNLSPHPSGTGWIVSMPKDASKSLSTTVEDDATDQIYDKITLEKHMGDVEEVALSWGRSLGLPESMISDMALAARLHDMGKADPRFQVLLWGGNRLLAARSPLLAKSVSSSASLAGYADMKKAAGYPEGARHELLSCRLAESVSLSELGAHDQDLVLHLIASHHGWCRPFAPGFNDPKPRKIVFAVSGKSFEATSDCLQDGKHPSHYASGVSSRFWRLVRRYGWWGLSYLEAVFRLSDHHASELEAGGGVA